MFKTLVKVHELMSISNKNAPSTDLHETKRF